MSAERLLLVDDDDNLRSMLDAALNHHGFAVTALASGRDALAALPTVAPDLVVLDVMMPDLDGFEVCRRLRADGSKVPVLFLTAKDSVEDKVTGLTLGGDDYLVKPFSLEELVARVQALLRRSGMTRSDGSLLECADLVLDEDTGSEWAGRAIGTLERWIMTIFMALGQYSAMGLTLTAKSIVRFSKIEKDPAFAEYYLLGTLYSMLIALLVGLALKVVLA